MTADNLLAIGLLVAWLVLRVLTRRWVERKLRLGTISMDGAIFVHAATFAVIPLLALPFRHSPSDMALFVALSGAMFLGQLLLTKLMLRFVKGRS